MLIPMRRMGAIVLGLAAVLGPWSEPAHAQIGPWGGPGFGLYGVGMPGTGFGLNGVGMPGAGVGLGGLGLRGGLGGYGALLRTGGYGAYGMGGYGLYGGFGLLGFYGTQWMMNPYEGYLQGAASVTKANAQYRLTIQQAKLMRQEAIRSSYQTRRAAIEEAEYERAHMTDPEKVRREQLARELDHARVSPPLTEIWSGKSLNVLLRNAIAQQSQGVRGPNVPISEDTLKAINPTAGDTRANVALLKDNGNLQWPTLLQNEAFKEAREDLSKRLKHAVNTAQLNRGPDESSLRDMQTDLKRLKETLDANATMVSPDEYIEANRFLRQLGDALTALKDRNVSNMLGNNWAPRAKNVAELVKFMADKGLWFAPAASGDESAYLALYHALAAFDAGLPRVASAGGDTNIGDKK